MDPHVVFDCQNILPNRFALSLAAAARARALTRGAEPRLDPRCASASEVALQEIACGAFAYDEMAPFLFASQAGARFLPPAPRENRASRRRPFKHCRRTRRLIARGGRSMMSNNR
ncbi:DNA-directed RNA polymerase subunit omega [Rhizobium lentis]|nr:DNA-directed RNA polymerase subunit omega [Rhizobium lentis]